jgi:hypothetical protein
MLVGSHQPKTATSSPRLVDNAGDDYDGRSVGEIPRMVAMQQKQNDELLDAICRLECALASVVFSGVAGDVAEDPNARSNGANSSLGAYMLDNIKKTERHTDMVNSLINRLAL